jgi:hypothetical protein
MRPDRAFAACVSAALAIACAAPLHAESLLLRGTVGAHPVVMQIDADDDDAFGNYFYAKYRQDIPLRGASTQDGYALESASYDSDETGTDRFVLVRRGDGFAGSFVHGDNKPLPVELHAVAPGSVADPRPDLAFAQPLSGYERLRLAGMRFVPGREETVDGKYRIRWLSEPLSGIEMFHVVGGYPEAAMDAINRIIDRDFYESLSQHFGCADGEGGSGDEPAGITSRYFSDRFVSYAVSDSWSCFGAAHPDFGIRGTTIDARSGRELALEDVYWLGTGGRPARNSDAWHAYRRDVFAPAVVALFRRLYPAQIRGSDDADCDYSDPSVWEYAPWYLTDRGLSLGAYFARAARACDNPDWSVVPYGELEKRDPARFAH